MVVYKCTCEIKVHKRERCYIVLTSYIPVKYEPVRNVQKFVQVWSLFI